MFRFEDSIFLYLLLVIPLLAVIHYTTNYRRRKRLRKFGDPALMKELMPDVSRFRPNVKFWLMCIALSLLIVMLARPQFGTKVENEKRNGIETIIAMDISNSMLAEDVQPSRLDKSKMLVETLVDNFENDKVGLVIFAGEAFTQLPITSDYVSAKLFLNTLSPDLIQTQGTAIGAAIDLCNRSFGPKGEAERAIIVITDGENFEDNATESAKLAAEQGIQTHVVGMGDLQGAPIPLGNGRDFRKDREGNVVIPKLNEQMCREIAAAGEGVYVRSDNANAALRVLTKKLDTLTKADVEGAVYSEYDEQFQALAWIMLVLLVIDVFIEERRSRLFRSIKLF